MPQSQLPYLPRVDALVAHPAVFDDSPEAERLFAEAMAECDAFHRPRQPYLDHLAQRFRFHPPLSPEPGDWRRLPPLFAGVMKLHRFLSIPEEEVALTLTSSGTGGQKTQLCLDRDSLARVEGMGRVVFRALGFCDPEPAHYLMFGYDPSEASDVGTSWSAAQKMACAPAKSVRWLIRRDPSGAFDFDPEEAARYLLERKDDAPLRLVGFPAFMHRAFLEAARLSPGVKVHPRSFLLAGGGWKSHGGTPMTAAAFAAFAEETVGLPAERVRDTFGMAEHGVPYGACRFGHHHVPVFGRMLVRDPLTLEILPHGQEGLLELLTPYNGAQPNQAVLSSDLAVLGRDCPCGLPGDYLASVRRGGVHQHKGCAVAAQEILNRRGGTAR